MIDKKKVLRDLCEVEYRGGILAGRYEIEELVAESAENYLDEMILFAKMYEIEFDESLENYKEEDDEPEYYTKLFMGSCLGALVEQKLIDILLDRNESKRILV